MSLLGGDGTELQKILLDEGLYLSTAKFSKDHLRIYINQFHQKKTALLTNQIGWYKGRYVLPHHTYALSNSLEEVIFHTDEATPVYHQRGTSEEWKINIAKQVEGNSILEFIIGCQFAAPLLELSGEDNFMVHLFGKSTSGKSTSQYVACSVTGKFMKNGDCNKLPSWKATGNGLEAAAREHNDSCMILDEIGQANSVEIGDVVYLLINGVTKTRAYKNAHKSPNVSTFSLIGVSTGELTLADKINDSDGYKKKKHTGGQSVRCIDIPVDSVGTYGIFQTLNGYADGAEFSKSLKATSKKYCGTIFHDWMTYVVNNQESVLKRLEEYKADWMERNPVESTVDPQVGRVRDKFALVAAVLRIATEENFLPWNIERASKCAKDFYKAWMTHRGGSDSHEYMKVRERLRKIIFIDGSSRFENSWQDKCEKIINRAGFRKEEEIILADGEKGTKYMHYIEPDVFRDEILCGANERSTLKKLIEDGCIIANPKGGSTHSVYVPREGQVRLFMVGSLNK